MGGLLTSIGAGFKAIAAFFGYAQQRDAEKNAPAMQARAAGATDQQIKDAAAKSIAAGNVEEIRKDLAE